MKARWPAAIILCLLQASTAQAVDSREPDSATPREMVLWYRQAAQRWPEGMPLGNGLIGAVIFGGVSQERIALE